MKGLSPLSMGAYTDDPMLQLAASWAYNKHDVGLPCLKRCNRLPRLL